MKNILIPLMALFLLTGCSFSIGDVKDFKDLKNNSKTEEKN